MAVGNRNTPFGKIDSIHVAANKIYRVVQNAHNNVEITGETFTALIDTTHIRVFSNPDSKALFYFDFKTRQLASPAGQTRTIDFMLDIMEKIVDQLPSTKEEKPMLVPEPNDVLQDIKRVGNEILLHLTPQHGLFLFEHEGAGRFISRGLKGKDNDGTIYIFEGKPVDPEVLAVIDPEIGYVAEHNSILTYGQVLALLEAALNQVKGFPMDVENLPIARFKTLLLNKLQGSVGTITCVYANQTYFVSRGQNDKLLISTRHKDRLEVVVEYDGHIEIQPAYSVLQLFDIVEIMKAANEVSSVALGLGIFEPLIMRESQGKDSIDDYLLDFHPKLAEITKKHFVRDCMEITSGGLVIATVDVYPDSWCIGSVVENKGVHLQHFVASRQDNTYQRTIYSSVNEFSERNIRATLNALIVNIDVLKEPASKMIFNLDDLTVSVRRELDKEFHHFSNRFTKKYKSMSVLNICLEDAGTLTYDPNKLAAPFTLRQPGTHTELSFLITTSGTVGMFYDSPNGTVKPLDEVTMETLKKFL